MSIEAPDEGEQVTYAGPGWTEPSRGTLLAITGSSGHVKWETGPDAGRITPAAMTDLMGTGVSLPLLASASSHVGDGWEDSLEIGDGIVREGARDDLDDEFLFGMDGFDA